MTTLCSSARSSAGPARRPASGTCLSLHGMAKQGYPPVNNEETIFMKWDGEDFIIHELFVDDMQHTSTSQRLMNEFMAAYARDFEITGGEVMNSFLGLQVDLIDSEIYCT
jgi:hypothetical protein